VNPTEGGLKWGEQSQKRPGQVSKKKKVVDLNNPLPPFGRGVINTISGAVTLLGGGEKNSGCNFCS